MADEQLARISKAIHTLFFATEEAGERFKTLRASISTDDELAAYKALSIGLISFEPLPPENLAKLQQLVAEMEAREAEGPKKPPERISVEVNNDEDSHYAKRLLERMYARWEGTLDYEAGRHVFTFYSPYDEQGRRHTVFAEVSVDGYCPDLTFRRYVLGPYLRVTDERTQRESDDPWTVLNGDLSLILPELPEADAEHRVTGGDE